MDLSTLRAQIALSQKRLSEIVARLDGLSEADIESLSYALAPLLERLNADRVDVAPAEIDLLPPAIDLPPDQYQSILDAVSAGILIYDRNQIIRYVNLKARHYIGYDPSGQTRDDYMKTIQLADMTGKPLPIHERPANLVWDGILARDVPMMITNAHGQVFQVLVTAIPLFLDGAFNGAVVIWNDVTLLEKAILEIKRQEEQLRASEARFRVALANSNIFVYALDRDLRYTWLYSPRDNESAQRVLGMRNDEILPDENVRELEELKRKVIETGVGVRKEFIVVVQGETHVFDMTFEPMRDSTGQVVGLTGASMDITEKRHLEAQQNEYAARMELHHRLIEQREQNLLHFAEKINDGPLQGMISLIADIQLAREVAPEGSTPQVMDEIEARARALADDLKRICGELNPPSATRFGLKRAIQAHTRDLQNRYPNIVFRLELMEDILKLPEATCLVLYRIYREAIQNAIQHAAAPEIYVRIQFSAGDITLEISDNGIGFTPQANGMELIQDGRFGLVSMKEQAESIQGKFVLVSEPGKGTRVVVTAKAAE